MNQTGILDLARDLRKGVNTFSIDDKTYNANEANDVLRQALITAGGGSDKIDYKSMRRNKTELFEIIEDLVQNILQEGLDGSEFWMNYVDEKNMKLGDQNLFEIPNNTLFVCAEIANGVATPRRQRIDQMTSFSLPTYFHNIRIYEEFSRFMSNRIDWSNLCSRVAKSYQQEIWNDIYAAFNGISANTIGLNSNYVKQGGWDEETMLTLIDNVEASDGQDAVIIGTKSALSKVTTAELSHEAKTNMFNDGFYGKFRGTPMVALKQKHVIGSDNFILDPHRVYVVASGEKFIKYVTEGDVIMNDKPYTTNADYSIEYMMTSKFGVGVAFTGRFGQYTIN